MTRIDHPPDSSTPPDGSVGAGEFATALQGLLEVSRAARSGAEMGPVLEAIARAASETLAFRSVVLNVYRPEWDDFCAEIVYGSDEVREALLGQVYERESWERLLEAKFRRSGAYFIPHEAFDWSRYGGTRFVPSGEAQAAEGAWDPADELLVLLERSDGELLGIMSFGEPSSGLRPDDEQLSLAVTLASHAALALETAQERERLRRDQLALEQLLRVSSRLPQTASTDEILASVCEGVREALGFEKVLIELRQDDGDVLRPVAGEGWGPGERARSAVLELPLISRLFEKRFEIAGCYLVPREEAERLVGESQRVYESTNNGKGPLAWNRHWLVVPLYHTDGTVRGVLWADEPRTRLLPNARALQALRVFANHAMEALAVSTQLAETRFLAEHDPLTRLLNRRALMRELQEAGDPDLPGPQALVFLDLDNFKEINDEHGHAVGDRVLASFASLLGELVRSTDHAFRAGGDEFALLLHGAGENESRKVVSRVIAAVEASIDPLVRTLTASFGIATSSSKFEPEELLRIADEAMYQAKRSGTQIEVAAA